MASEQQRQMNELYASIKERLSNPDVDLATLQGRHPFKPNRFRYAHQQFDSSYGRNG